MEFASRTRETFIELAPGETKSWRLPPCAEGVFNIWVKQINGPAPIGGGGGGGGGHVGGGNAGGIPRVVSHTPDVVSAAGPAGTVARYRAPWGGGLDINDLGEVVLVDDGPGTGGGGMGPAGGLTVDLLRKDAVAKSDPNHIFFKTPNAGDVWSLRIARRADGSTDTRRYRIEVTYPSVLPVERRRIPARFFTRGFQKNWSENPYLDYLRLIGNKIGYRWNARFAEMYGKPQGDQYISLTDSLDLPDVSMSSLTLSVGGEEAPPVYKFPDGMPRPIMPYLKLRVEGRCDGSRMLAVNTPGPNFIKVELPEQLSAEVKFFLGTEGSGTSPTCRWSSRRCSTCSTATSRTRHRRGSRRRTSSR